MNRGRFNALLTISLWGLVLLAACGSNESGNYYIPPADNGNGPGPEETITCESLDHLLEPRTGATFTCWGCSKEWTIRIPSDSGTIFFVIEFTCTGLGGEASLRLLDPNNGIALDWHASPGDNTLFCIPQGHTRQGRYAITLSGNLPFELISHFKGSVWFNVVNEKGEVIIPSSAPAN